MSQQLLQAVEKSSLKTETPKFSIGDTVDVHTRILEGEKERIQIFNGVVIARSGSGSREMFVVRRIVQGDPAEEITKAAADVGAGLLVVGNKGLTGMRGKLLGSVPKGVVADSPCDVLIVRTVTQGLGEIAKGEGGLVEVAGERGHHAVLAEERPHRLDIHSGLFQMDQVADFIVAVEEIDGCAVVVHFAVPQLQLGGVGVHDPHSVALVVILCERLLFIRAAAGVLRLQETDVLRLPPDRIEMVQYLLDKQLAHVLPNL